MTVREGEEEGKEREGGRERQRKALTGYISL